MGTVLVKLQPDNTLLVDANADAGHDLVSVGVSGNCNLLGLRNGGIELSTCSTFSLCQTLPGLFDTYSSQVLDLSKPLGLKCGVGELQFEVQAVVRKLAFVETSCQGILYMASGWDKGGRWNVYDVLTIFIRPRRQLAACCFL
jgi:hypothetical protein